MRRVLPLLPLLLLAGCRPAPEPTPAPVAKTPRKLVLAAGTPVRLILLDELTSGGAKEGDEVRLALAEPVGGLPTLTPARATVAWSRSEGTLGGLTNRPARLTLKLESLTAPNGESIPLSALRDEPADYELNRANTGRPEQEAPAEEGEPDAAALAVRDLVAKGEAGGLDPREVGDLARRLGMRETERLADAGKLDEVQKLLGTVRAGGSIANLAGGTPIAAALEMVRLAGDAGRKLGRTLGGRNIRAYPGTEIPAFVAQDTEITLD